MNWNLEKNKLFNLQHVLEEHCIKHYLTLLHIDKHQEIVWINEKLEII
jgi:hypothetical protein